MNQSKAQELVSSILRQEWATRVKAGSIYRKPAAFFLDVDLTPTMRAFKSQSGPSSPADYPINNAAGKPVVPNINDVSPDNLPEWCVFVDDDPNANWEHPCRYMFVTSKETDPQIYSVADTLPPDTAGNFAILPLALQFN